MASLRKPADQVEIGTPIRWLCQCGRDLPATFLTRDDLFVATAFGSVCEVEVITEEEALVAGAKKPS